MRYATNYDIGDRKRGQGINEDSLSVTVFEEGHRDGYRGETRGDDRPANRSAGVFVLADGAGGYDAGDAASYIATTVIAERLAPVAIGAVRSHPGEFGVDLPSSATPDPLGHEDAQAAIADAVVDAHREILAYGQEAGTTPYTTVVAGLYADGKLHLGWVGDSRAYVVNAAREEIVRLTKDHAVVERLADEGEIDEVEARVHPDGNEITRALGGPAYGDPAEATVDVETRTVPLYAEDTVVATSDGLIDAQTDAPGLYREYTDSDRDEDVGESVLDAVVTDAEIRDVVLEADSLSAAAREYVDLANDRGGKDNLSVVLLADDALPATPSGGLPVRAADPEDVLDRETIIVRE